MMELSCAIEGTCMYMCPEGEMIMREREGLLHYLETVRGENCQPDVVNRRKSFGKSPSKLLLKADPDKIVKEYSRSAAGRSDLDPSSVRPASVLKRTMVYLLKDVAVLEMLDWTEVYDFVFDRIRAVRQDMTIQGIVGRDAIAILQQTVRFHAFASYRLRNCEFSDFDPVINKHHLLECLKELLCLYQTTDGPHENQPEFESIYLCDNLGNEAALTHCLSLPSDIRNHPLVSKCFHASLSALRRNFERALRLVLSLRCLTCLSVVSYHLDRLRIDYLKILSHGYSVKNCQFPVHKLSQLLRLSVNTSSSSSSSSHNPHTTNTDTTIDATTTTTTAATTTTTTLDLCNACHLVDWFTTTESSLDHISFSKSKFTRPTDKRPCPPIPALDNLLHSSLLPNVLTRGTTEGARSIRDGLTECRSGVGGGGGGEKKVMNANGLSSNLLSYSMDRQMVGEVDGLRDRLECVGVGDGLKKGGVGGLIVREEEKKEEERVDSSRGGRGRGRRRKKESKGVGRRGDDEGGGGGGEEKAVAKSREEGRVGGGGGVSEIQRGRGEKIERVVGGERGLANSSRGESKTQKERGENIERVVGGGGLVTLSKGRGRGRGRRRKKEEDDDDGGRTNVGGMMEKKIVGGVDGGGRDVLSGDGEGKGGDDGGGDGSVLSGEGKGGGDEGGSWEDWSESEFSREMNEKFENR